jgi:hypothetical protein
VIKDIGALQSKPWWAPRVVPPEGGAERPADHHRRRRLRCAQHLRRRDPDADDGPLAAERSALQQHPLHRALLADAGGADHRAQPPLGGFGVISEQSTGFPGYNSIIAKDKATIGRILLDNGYATSWFGKDHNTPAFAASQVGPVRPVADRHGLRVFLRLRRRRRQPVAAEPVPQHHPDLSLRGQAGWNLITGMADDAIDYTEPDAPDRSDKPFFVKYAPGATHAPHHPTKEWVEKIRRCTCSTTATNKLRETIFENQKKLGVIPEDATLTPWPTTPQALGPADRRGEEAVHQAGRGLRRLCRLFRPRDRPRHPGHRGHRQARQHADHLHQRRQRHQRRGRPARHAQRGRLLQRRQHDARRDPDEVVRRLGHRGDLQPHVGRAGPGPSTRRSTGSSRTPRSWAASGRTWW